jgi:LCP family protein required for cell wall assembly
MVTTGYRRIVGTVVYAICCAAAGILLVVSYNLHDVYQEIAGLEGSGGTASGPTVGAQNILVMGLESRKDWDGNVLPANVLAAMHAGSVQGVEDGGVGGWTTNTLILIHIFPGGKKAVGFSIPRDDWVTYPTSYLGQSQGKVDQAYGDALSQEVDQVAQQKGATQDQEFTAGNQAGAQAAVATVEALTGVHVDHYVAINLDGFYELANVIGGVEVCLNHPVSYDVNSGFYAHHAGYQHLNAAMTLAFVRERDNLTNGDLDRTHRQQAVLDYVLWKLKNENVFDSLSQVTSLLADAKEYLRTNLDLLSFATQMQGLTGRNMTFYTAPVVTTDGHIDGQDVNLINPAQIRQDIQQKFSPAPAGHGAKKTTTAAVPPASTTVNVYNGGQTPNLAANVASGLTEAGFKQGQVGDSSTHPASTEVLYGTGEQANATNIAALFGVSAQPSTTVAAGQVEVVLSSSATLPNFGSLTATDTPTSTAGDANNSQAGGPVTVKANAIDGIPCVN